MTKEMMPFIVMTYDKFLRKQGGSENLPQDLKPAADLCFLNMRALLAHEIIDRRADPNIEEVMEQRYAEIAKALGPHMVEAVKDWVRRQWPPYCLICGSEKELGPEGAGDKLEVYSAGGGSADWMHRSCTVKFHSSSKDQTKAPHPVPPLEVVDAAWRKKYPGEMTSRSQIEKVGFRKFLESNGGPAGCADKGSTRRVAKRRKVRSNWARRTPANLGA